jgi:hypothetical protein
MEEEISSETFKMIYLFTLHYIPKESKLQETTNIPLSVGIIDVRFICV